MFTSDERKLYENFQARVADVVDEYLLLGADPDQIREILQAERVSNLEARRLELEGAR